MPYGCTLKLFYLIAEEERDRPKWRLELVDPGSDKTYSFDIALLQVFIHPCPDSPFMGISQRPAIQLRATVGICGRKTVGDTIVSLLTDESTVAFDHKQRQ